MELLTGTFESTLDDKGRVSIPARLRERYGNELVITQGGKQHSAWIMTPPVWEQFEKKLMGSEAVDEEDYNLIQHGFIYPARTVETDKSGRIPVPAAIRKWASLTKDCLVISAENHLEIWDADFHYAYLNENGARLQDAVKKMGAIRLFKLDSGEKI
jgi:MraZ protein